MRILVYLCIMVNVVILCLATVQLDLLPFFISIAGLYLGCSWLIENPTTKITNKDTYTEHVIKTTYDSKDIVQLEDGHFYFIPSTDKGAYSEFDLEVLARELAKKNNTYSLTGIKFWR